MRKQWSFVFFKTLINAFPFVLCILFFAGCKKDPFISKVTFRIEPNAETLKVNVYFTQNLQTDLGGTYEISIKNKTYGYLELQPSSAVNPFSIGFRMDYDILNEQNFLNLQPMSYIQPLDRPFPIANLNRALMQLEMKKELNPKFDLYAYLDVTSKGGEWLGMVVSLNFLNNGNFQGDLVSVQGFAKNSKGQPQIYASFYSPKRNDHNQIIAPAGVALFANAKSLITNAKEKRKQEDPYDISIPTPP